jgi:neutral amino acid transport system permease protein
MADLLDAFTLGVRAMFAYQAVFFALLAIGLNLHFGYTGLLNFGQIAFAMVGGYGIAISVSQWDLPWGVGVAVGLGAAVVLALLLGLPTLRLRADYLAIVTIAAAEALRLLFRSVSATDVTGSTTGLYDFNGGFISLAPWETGRRYDILGTRWSGGELWVVTVGWALVLLGSLLVWALMRSPWGRVLRAVREDEDAARSLGKNVYAFKMQSLVLGGLFGALGGMVYAMGTSAVNPDQYQNANTFLAYGALILGGAARVVGPVIGAMLLWFIIAFSDSALAALVSEGRSFFGLFEWNDLLSSTDVAYIRFIIIGLGLMLLMIFRPQGILGDRREVMLDAR